MKILAASAAALLLAACSGNDAGNNANADMTFEDVGAADANVATGNLTLDSSAGNVDQAINATDQQSGVPQTVDNATAEADNRM